jgi:hypothetical protein
VYKPGQGIIITTWPVFPKTGFFLFRHNFLAVWSSHKSVNLPNTLVLLILMPDLCPTLLYSFPNLFQIAIMEKSLKKSHALHMVVNYITHMKDLSSSCSWSSSISSSSTKSKSGTYPSHFISPISTSSFSYISLHLG